MRAEHYFKDLPTDSIRNNIIFLDIDGTFVVDGTADIDQESLDTLKRLREHNEVYLCTNGRDVERNSAVEKKIGLAIINGGIRKPSKKILGKLTSPPTKPLVVIGDKYLTDGIFARRLHAHFIKVKRLRGKEAFSIRLSYLIDDISAFFAPYVFLIRPWQWVKNLLIFAPLFFAGGAFHIYDLFLVFVAAAVFCVASSAMYIFNDMFDLEQDRQHPVKKNRPLASGWISKKAGGVLAATLLVLSGSGIYIVPAIAPVIAVYVLFTMLYSFKLKHVAVLDLVCVALFYVMRVIAGGAAVPVSISPWIILCVFFGSLFVIIGKRRAEFSRDARRAVLKEYSRESLDYMLVAGASLAVMTYGIWSVIEHDSPVLVYSTVFVLFALFRLLNRIQTDSRAAETPEILVFKDPWILSSFLSWLLYVFFVFYFAW